MEEVAEKSLSYAVVEQAFNAVDRAASKALDEKTIYDKRLDALETAIERTHDAREIFKDVKGSLTESELNDLTLKGRNIIQKTRGGHKALGDELNGMPFDEKKKQETAQRLDQAGLRIDPKGQNAAMPPKEEEAHKFLKIQHSAITEAINPKLQMTTEDKVNGLERAAFNLTARERTTKMLQLEGVDKKTILAIERETQKLATSAQKWGKAVEKEVKQLPRDDRQKGFEKSIGKSIQSIGKALGRSR